MKGTYLTAVICLIVLTVSPLIAGPPIRFDVNGFRDGAAHWRGIRDKSRIMQAEKNQPVYRPEQIREIAENILLFQRENGGWPKDYDMLAVLTDEQREKVRLSRASADTSFDNHNVFPQVEFLARAYQTTGEAKYREGAERGLDFILSAQYPSGGFPQWFPRNEGYHGHITFNDGAMMGCLQLLRAVADGEPHMKWVDQERHEKSKLAVERGIECILKCQIRSQGQLTGWCQQHDRETYEAAPARTFELASICPGDTTEITEFLMQVERPSPLVIESIEASIAWLKSVRLRGTAVKRVPGAPVEFERHSADFDVIVVQEQNAPPIWARHYEIGTNRPIFASRDGVKQYELSQVDRERRTGSKWYGEWPTELINRAYPEWKRRVSPNANSN